MTTEKPSKAILRFAAVMFVSLLVQKLYSVADGVVVGRMVGDIAFTAIGATNLVITLEQTFCSGFCGAISAYIARKVENLGNVAFNALISSLFVAIPLALVYTTGAGWLLRLLRTPEELFDSAYLYLFLNGLRIPIDMVFNYASCTSQAIGDSKLPSKYMILSTVLNIVFDIPFVYYFGVAGAAVATILASFVSCTFLINNLWKAHDNVVPSGSAEARECLRIIGFCLPMGLQGAITSIGGLFMQYAFNGLGAVYVTASTAGTKIYNILSCAFVAIGSAITVFCGQNSSAGDMVRTRSGVRFCMKFVVFYSVVSFALLWGTCDLLVRVFLPSASVEVMQLSRQFTLYTAFFFIPLGAVNVIRNAIQGLGYTFVASMNGVFELAGRAFAAFVLVPLFGFTAACLMYPVCWLLACAFLVPAYFVCIKKVQNAVHK